MTNHEEKAFEILEAAIELVKATKSRPEEPQDLMAMGPASPAPTVTQRYRDERDYLNKRLREVNDLLNFMEQNPELGALLDNMSHL